MTYPGWRMRLRLQDPKDYPHRLRWYRCLQCEFKARGIQWCPYCEARMVEEK